MFRYAVVNLRKKLCVTGTLAAGGSVAGNIYFDGDIKKALYFANMFDKSATASWVLA